MLFYFFILTWFDSQHKLLNKYIREDSGDTEKDEENINKIVANYLKEESSGYFELTDDLIFFYLNAAYDLSDWASRTSYSTIEIPNEWDI